MRAAIVISTAACYLAGSSAPAFAQGIAPAVPVPQVAAAPAALAEPDPAKVEIGRQIIAIMFPPDRRDAMIASSIDAILAQFRASVRLPPGFEDPGLKKIMDDTLASIPERLRPALQTFLPRMWEAMSHAYARRFSTSELNDILAFARTPSGQRYFQNSTAILSDPDIASANTAYFSAIQGLSDKVRADVAGEVADYLKAHPEVAAKLSGGAAPAK